MAPHLATTTTVVSSSEEVVYTAKGKQKPVNQWGRTEEEERKRNLCLQAAKNDLNAPRREYYFTFPKGSRIDNYVDSCLNDPRDKTIFNMLMNVSVVSLPLFFLMFAFVPNSKFGHMLGLGYFLIHFVLFLHSYILALHYSTHRPLMKKGSGLSWMNYLAPYVLCPTFGIPSGLYYIHHILMHHCHDNCIPYDQTSTEPYQRDSVLDFSVYWFRFWATIWYDLPKFAFKLGYYKVMTETLLYMAIYFSYMYITFQYNPVVFTWGIFVPFFFTQFMLAYGNFSQHMFVEGGKPSNYRSTYNCVDCYDNTKSFQDGYHIQHHLNSKNHWSNFPETFMKGLDKMNEEKALTFNNIGFFECGLLVFLGKLDVLAKKAVTPWDHTEEELIELMKERLKPIKQTAMERRALAKELKEKSDKKNY